MKKPNFSQGLQILFFLGTRVVVLYAAFLFLLPGVNITRGVKKARRATLSRLIPPYDYLKKYEKGLAAYDERSIDDYYFYYTEVSRLFPKAAESRAMLGYLAFQKGRSQEAMRWYQEALALRPAFMNFSLNLGLIFFHQGEYSKALPFFTQALSSTIPKNFSNITSSPIYFPLYESMDTLGKDLAVRMKNNFEKAYKGLVLCHYLSGRYKECINGTITAMANPLSDKGFFYFFTGLSLYQLGDYANAKIFFMKSLEHPLPAQAVRLIAALKPGPGKMGFPDNWNSQLQEVLKNNPWKKDFALTLF